MRTFAALLTILAGLSHWPAVAQSPGVVVEFNSPHLTVQLTQPCALRVVVEEVCRVTQTRCEWDEKALQALGAETVPAMIFRGTLTETLTQLLAGTNLNYATFEPGDGRSGRLWVEYRAPVSPALAGESDPAGERRRGSSRNSPRREDSPFTPNKEARGDEDDPMFARADGKGTSPSALDFSLPSSAGVSAGVSPEPPEAVVFMDGQNTPYTGPPVSPFPDEMGNPVPVSEQPTDGSPFPGIEAKPTRAGAPGEGQPPESPFPP